METNPTNINQLLEKLEKLLVKQQVFSIEIDALKKEIYKLKTAESDQSTETQMPEVKVQQPEVTSKVQPEETIIEEKEAHKVEAVIEPPKETFQRVKPKKLPKVKTDLEKFIGENLINKIGIVITVIGVAIGAKYTIEHDLISPLTRIILGYLVGLGLLGVGIKLKKKYTDFSAVLVSGAISIMYFLTYAAYSFYGLIPQPFAFALMVLFTIFTVVAAINYNRQVIAAIGLVGAYAVPFLLSQHSGRIDILFSYMLIINIGILIIAFKKYWKGLYYAAFILTWLIYIGWYFSDYETEIHFKFAAIFLFLFFITFYAMFLAYKLIKKEKFARSNILLLLSNSFIFFGLGYSLLSSHETGNQLLGLFTLCNAILHFIVSAVVYKQKLADRNLFFLISGLVLVFLTVAIPIQLDGNWVTLLWVGEATLLFWIGRTKKVPVYEKLSYPLMILALFSIIHDWSTVESISNYSNIKLTPIFNINFLTSVIFIAAFSFINFIHHNKKYPSPSANKKGFLAFFSYAIPVMLLGVIYYAFKVEIDVYFNQLYTNSAIKIKPEENGYATHYYNEDYNLFKTIWNINYTLLFLTLLSFVNIKKIKSRLLGVSTIVFNTLAIVVFLTVGLYTLSELRESYLEQTLSEYFQRGTINLGIRYISFVFVAALIVTCYYYIRQQFMKVKLKVAFDLLLHISILWIASSELINWMDIAASTQSYKLGLSILWGAYSLLLIAFGIFKKKKYLRVGAIALFAVTLLKLFLYDIAHLNTISKTIVLVSLGILLLVISFLYNKYKHLISDEIEN